MLFTLDTPQVAYIATDHRANPYCHLDAKDIDAKTGDYVTVPVRAPHTFGNPFDEEARFFNTFTPAFYVNYFKLLSDLVGEGPMTPEINKQAMASYATLPVLGK